MSDIKRLEKERDYAVRWANKAIDDMKASYEAELSTLRDRIEELERAKWQQQHVDTMNDMASLRIALESAESKLAEARAEALEEAALVADALDPNAHDIAAAIRALKSGGANG